MRPELKRHHRTIQDLCRQYHVARLDLFGSAAIDDDRANASDFDFLVEFEDLPRGAYAEAYFGLLEALTALLGRPVDLVVSSAIRNPYFREQVDKTKTSLYAA